MPLSKLLLLLLLLLLISTLWEYDTPASTPSRNMQGIGRRGVANGYGTIVVELEILSL